MVAICEAVELLLEAGHVPAQDVWLSFGCDEEVSGTAALAAVDHLRTAGVAPVVRRRRGRRDRARGVPRREPPLGVIGVTEKGTTSVELVAEGRGGHASTPARNGPTARIARGDPAGREVALPRLRAGPDAGADAPDRPAPAPPAAAAARPAPTGSRRPITRALLAAGPEAAAMTRTTVAATTLSGSPALNVIASTATAGLNVRVMVGDTVAGVVDHLRAAIKDDDIRIDVVESGEPSPVSPMDEAFELIEEPASARCSPTPCPRRT